MFTETGRDELTGLYRRGVLKGLNREFRSRDASVRWSLMVIDLDHFKLINDLCGHLEGDRVLELVAGVISNSSRSSDTVLRYGGDEFITVMPSTSQMNAVNQAERILEQLRRITFSPGVEVNLSIGVAESMEKDSDLMQVFERADKALFQAKNEGRGRVSFYTETEIHGDTTRIAFDHFVNRHTELDKLRSQLTLTIENGSRLVVVTGESGVGKSRLVEELKHYCVFRETAFIKFKCDELGTDRQYIQLAAPMGNHFSTLDQDSIRDLSEKVGPVLPHTLQILPGLDLPLESSAVSADSGVIGLRIHSEISVILKWLASRTPVVFHIDSLQWISTQDLDLLAYLVRTAGNSPILFIASARTPLEDYPEVNRVVRILSSIVPSAMIALEPLSDEYIGHMVMFALKDPNIPGKFLQKLKKGSGGNPLYLRELLLSLQEKGLISQGSSGGWEYSNNEDFELPESVSILMQNRLENVNVTTRRTLGAAALCPGGLFSIDPLSSVLQRDELDVAIALEEMVTIGILNESVRSGGVPEYRFTQDTMRSYLYREMARGTRVALQTRYGAYWEKQFENGIDRGLSLAAHHYCDSLNVEKAREFAIHAGEEASIRDSKREALGWLEKYLQFASFQSEDRATGFRARVKAGKLCTQIADYEKAGAFLEKAAEFAESEAEQGQLSLAMALLHFNKGNYYQAKIHFTSARGLLPPGEDRIAAGIREGFMHHMLGSGPKALDLLEEARMEIEALSDSDLQMKLMASYYRRHGFISLSIDGGRQKGTEECWKSVDIYRQLGDRSGEAKALLATASTLSSTSYYASRIEILEEALKVLSETGDVHAMMVAFVNLGQAYDNAGEYRRSREYFNRCLRLVEATGTKRFGVWAHCHLGILDLQENLLESAEKNLRLSAKLADNLGLGRMSVISRTNLIMVLAESNKLNEAETLMDNLKDDETLKNMGWRIVKTLAAAKAKILLKRNETDGDHRHLDEAERLLQKAIELADDTASPEKSEFLTELALCLERQNRPVEALKQAERAVKALDSYISSIDSQEYRKNIQYSTTAEGIFSTRSRLRESLDKSSSSE